MKCTVNFIDLKKKDKIVLVTKIVWQKFNKLLIFLFYVKFLLCNIENTLFRQEYGWNEINRISTDLRNANGHYC